MSKRLFLSLLHMGGNEQKYMKKFLVYKIMKLNKFYKEFILEFKQKIYNAKTKAILSTNILMIERYLI